MTFQGLKVIDFQQSNYMHTLETAIQMGLPVILQNVQEKLDPSLDPVLTKSLVKVGEEGRRLLSLLPGASCCCSPEIKSIAHRRRVKLLL